MKHMTKIILIAALFTTPVWSAPEANDKVPGKPAHAEGKLTSPESVLMLKLDENGREQPVLSPDFVKTLNLGPAELVRVNQILQQLRQEYLAVEKQQLGKIKVTADPDGTKHLVVPPFRSERKALDRKLRAELGKVLDARQLRLAKQSNGLRAVDSNLFDWGIATYSITIRNTDNGYEIDARMDGGWLGPNGNSSMTRRQLPDKYLRLLAK